MRCAWRIRGPGGFRRTDPLAQYVVLDSNLQLTSRALPSETAKGWTLPPHRLPSAAGSAPTLRTGAAPRASYRRSIGGVPPPWLLSSRAIACAETGPLPIRPETRWETPGPWRCAGSATISELAHPD